MGNLGRKWCPNPSSPVGRASGPLRPENWGYRTTGTKWPSGTSGSGNFDLGPLRTLFIAFLALCGPWASAQETEPTRPEATERYEPVPPRVVPGPNGAPPSDAIPLFQGKDLDQWISSVDSTAAPWILGPDGSMTVKDRSGSIQTKRNFGSVQLHLEWRSPEAVSGSGQG